MSSATAIDRRIKNAPGSSRAALLANSDAAFLACIIVQQVMNIKQLLGLQTAMT